MWIQLFSKPFWKRDRLLLLTFLVVHTITSYYYISKQNITFDEPQYIEYAKHWLKGKPERLEPLDDNKSPIVAICWIPRIVRQILNPSYKLTDYGRKDQEEGRYMMIFFSFFTAIYVYWWCKDLYGNHGWVLPLLLLLFDPLYLAYSTLITTDLACGAFLVGTLYHFRKYLSERSQKHLYAAAVITGLAIVTKQTLLFLVLLLPLLSVSYALIHKSFLKLFSKTTIKDLVLFTVIVILIINVSYYFHRSFIPFGSYVFESNVLQSLQKNLQFISWVPVPLPESYVQSIDMIKAHADIGAGKPESTFNGVYLFGVLNQVKGWWYYYLVMIWYKLPIGILILLIAALPLLALKFKMHAFKEKYLFLILPIVFFWFILSFVNEFQTGIRHLLLVFPLLYIGLGKLLNYIGSLHLRYKIFAGALITYAFISVALYYPFIIAYTNEFIIDKKIVYKKIADSSVNYGQSDSSINIFLRQHPEYRAASAIPVTGKFIVGMNQICDTYMPEQNKYKWYYGLKPTGHYRYVNILFLSLIHI